MGMVYSKTNTIYYSAELLSLIERGYRWLIILICLPKPELCADSILSKISERKTVLSGSQNRRKKISFQKTDGFMEKMYFNCKQVERSDHG